MTSSRRAELDLTQSDGWEQLDRVAQLPGSVAQRYQLTDEFAASVPTNYEPRYAYPLIVWVCDSDFSQDQALDAISAISPQNYIGVTLSDVSFESQANGIDQAVEFVERLITLENQIVEAVKAIRDLINVHTERIYLAGCKQSATSVLEVLQHQPDWFAGAISFSGRCARSSELLAQRSMLGKRVFLNAPSSRVNWRMERETQQAASKLRASGASVTTNFDPSLDQFATSSPVSLETLAELDEWLIAGILESNS